MFYGIQTLYQVCTPMGAYIIKYYTPLLPKHLLSTVSEKYTHQQIEKEVQGFD